MPLTLYRTYKRGERERGREKGNGTTCAVVGYRELLVTLYIITIKGGRSFIFFERRLLHDREPALVRNFPENYYGKMEKEYYKNKQIN